MMLTSRISPAATKNPTETTHMAEQRMTVEQKASMEAQVRRNGGLAGWEGRLLLDEIDALTAREKRLTAANHALSQCLREIEWGGGHLTVCCPLCRATKEEGHCAGCRLKLAMDLTPPPPGQGDTTDGE